MAVKTVDVEYAVWLGDCLAHAVFLCPRVYGIFSSHLRGRTHRQRDALSCLRRLQLYVCVRRKVRRSGTPTTIHSDE
jgi:hypothetical protein